MFTMNDLLDIAVKMEQNGKSIYQKATDLAKNPELKSLLNWMAKEEASHEQWFSDLKNNQEMRSEDLQVMLPDVLKEMMGEKSLSLDDADFSAICSKGQMLATFMEFENDTILFYEFLETFINEDKTLTGLQLIIHQERTHVDKLREMIQVLKNDRPTSENPSYF